MAAGNSLHVVGNITRDPELAFTQAGTARVNFGLAWNQRKQVNGQWEETAHFIDCTAWDEQAENIASSLSKGDRVIVMGRLNFSSWEDKTTGDKRSKLDVTVEECGPALRWAEASVTKNPKKGGGTATPSASPQPSAATSTTSDVDDPF